jgi:hypothetical protein
VLLKGSGDEQGDGLLKFEIWRLVVRILGREFPDIAVGSGKAQGSFDFAGTSLREVPAALRMTWLLIVGSRDRFGEHEVLRFAQDDGAIFGFCMKR